MSTDHCRYRPILSETAEISNFMEIFLSTLLHSINNLMINRKVTKLYKTSFWIQKPALNGTFYFPWMPPPSEIHHINPTGFQDKGEAPFLALGAILLENGQYLTIS